VDDVLPIAPRLHTSLLAALPRLDAPDRPIAETNRLLGEVAELIGVPRPSYEQTRVYVHEHRQRRLAPGMGDVLLAVLSPAPKLALDRLFWEANRDRWGEGK
jgi:hypothetical protein